MFTIISIATLAPTIQMDFATEASARRVFDKAEPCLSLLLLNSRGKILAEKRGS